MAEQTDTLVNPVLQKKLDGYHVDNFSVPQELTVTITLSEYRELVTTKAVCDSKVSEAMQARWKVENERDSLKTSLAEINTTLGKVRDDLAVANKKNEELSHDLGVALRKRDEAVHQLEVYKTQSELSAKRKSK